MRSEKRTKLLDVRRSIGQKRPVVFYQGQPSRQIALKFSRHLALKITLNRLVLSSQKYYV
jgi:hypothetical protein